MKRVNKKTKLKLAQKFFLCVWRHIEDLTDFIYQYVDPECEYGDALCEMLNNDTILEVLRLGFKQKFGEELKCGKIKEH